MKKVEFKIAKRFMALALGATMIFAQSCNKDENNGDNPAPEPIGNNVLVDYSREGMSVFVDGVKSKETTPAELSVSEGQHTINVLDESNGVYLEQTVDASATEVKTVEFSRNDVVTPREWKVLVVGFKSANVAGVEQTYAEEDLDKIYQYVEDALSWVDNKCYGAMEFSFDNRSVDATVETTETVYDWGNLYDITPAQFEAVVNDIDPGTYDLIVTVFNDGQQWYNWPRPTQQIDALSCKASFLSNAFGTPDVIEGAIDYFINGDGQGAMVHNWLRSITQEYYNNSEMEDLGVFMPAGDQEEVMWRAEEYGYNGDNHWFEWYEDMIKAKVGKYYDGIGANALYWMNPRAYAKGELPTIEE
jgi:hypothetical protein